MNIKDVVIESERLIQKTITMEYAEAIFKSFNKDITKYMYPNPAENIEETYSFINSSIDGVVNGDNLQLVILKKFNQEFIGCSGIHDLGQINPALGIWIKREEHGNKYGQEAIGSLIKWARENVDFEYLKYPVDKRNYSSRRIPEINGGKIMKEYKKINLSNFELDVVEYWIYKG